MDDNNDLIDHDDNMIPMEIRSRLRLQTQCPLLRARSAVPLVWSALPLGA
jgi:hypothetical protein